MQAVHGAAINTVNRLVPCAVHASCLRRFRSPAFLPLLSNRRSQLSPKSFGSTKCSSAGRNLGMSSAVHSANAANAAGTVEGGTQLWSRLQHVYDTALAKGDVFKTDTDDKVYQDPALNVEFVLRVAAALNSKPKSAKPNSSSAGKPANPFLPYDEALWVANLSDTHVCLLNKFNVVAHHTLVVTRDFERQTDPLNAADFEATLQLLQAMPHGGIAYYNCGPQSGASQAHKHLQVVPLPLMEGLPPRLPFGDILAAATADAGGGMAAVEQLPYQCFAARLQPDRVSGEQLAALATAMLQECQRRNSTVEQLSYNVVLTREYLQIMPRSAEASGDVSVNALGGAGTFFVKRQEQLRYVEQRTPGRVLSDVGFQW